jgi:hypothetical protein
MRRSLVLLAVVALVALVPSAAIADDDDNDRLRAVPSTFVGTAPGCAPSPPGSRIVTAAWLNGMGLPDNAGPNNNTTATQRDDRRAGLLLSKNGLTTDCSAAGAEIRGVRGIEVTATFELGFDYRNGGHCSGGSPRFNVTARSAAGETFHFVGGCGNDSAPTGAPQDPSQWTRVRFQTSNAGESFPVIPAGSRIVSIDFIVDEGTDAVSAQDPMGAGLSVVDNIYINGRFIRSGSNDSRGRSSGNDDDDDDDEDDD